jgi:hypothetical protein
MDAIPPVTYDKEGYLQWMRDAGCYIQAIMDSSVLAFDLFSHADPIARCAAIGSFRYVWPCDSQCSKGLLRLANEDVDPMVRLTAAWTLMSLHIRANKCDKDHYLDMLEQVMLEPSQLSEIVADVEEHVKTWRPSARLRCE